MLIRNILAVVGLITVVVGSVITVKAASVLSEFNPKAPSTYAAFVGRLLESKDPGVALDYAVPVKEGVTYEDLKSSFKSLAKQNNVLYTGERPFYKQLEARTGKPHRLISFLSFCHPQSGQIISDYNDAYTSFMPSRIAVVEDKSGKLWLHTMRVDLMIYGGKTLPPEVKAEGLHVWETTRDMMLAAADGEF
jgi:hypothetical protein